MTRNYSSYASVLLLFLTIMAGVLLTNAEARADVIDDVNITVPASCSLSTNSGMGETYSVSMMPGQYKNDIGDTTISVFCNTNDTYAIYAIGYSNDTLGTTDMISNNTATTGDISTGTATNGSSSAWAMKLSSIAGTYAPTIENGFGSFSSVPSTYTKVASVSSAVTPNTNISSVKATYAVYISPTQKVATYTGKVKYAIVNPNNAAPEGPMAATPQCISYWPNASGVVDSMGDQCNHYGNNSIVDGLWPSNFQRPGYGFAGWSDKFDWVINENDANGNGTGANAGYHIYGPNAEITAPSNMATKGLSLYAVWVPSSGDLQTFTCPDNSTMPIGNITALKDQRDNNVYIVAKLADGKCWMTENLRLENNALHNSDGSLAQGYNSSFIGLADPETSYFGGYQPRANSLYSTDGSTAAPAITGTYPTYRFPRYNNQNTSNPVSNMTSWGYYPYPNIYSVSNYYTWAAAIADTSYYDTNNQSIATTSICPAGWSLPKGGDKNNTTNSDFWLLGLAIVGEEPANMSSEDQPYYYGMSEGRNASKLFRRYPNNFIYSGIFSDSASGMGSHGNYWSSTVRDAEYSYYFYIGSNGVYPGTLTDSMKYYGYSIRCVR